MENEKQELKPKKKWHTITLYLDDLEFDWLLRQAAAATTSKAGYVRAKLFTGKCLKAKVSLEKASWYRELQLMNGLLKKVLNGNKDPLIINRIEDLRKLNIDILKQLINVCRD